MTLETAAYTHAILEEVFARVPLAFSLAMLDDGRYLEVNDCFWRITG